MSAATDKRPPRKVSYGSAQTLASPVEGPETSRTAPQEGDSERFHEYVERRLAGYDHRATLCAFCGERGATDVYREEDCPDAPCCADEDACHARVLAL